MRAVTSLPRSAIAAVLAMIVLGTAVFFGIDVTVNKAVAVDAENKAHGWARYFIETMPDLDGLIASGKPDEAQLAVIATAERVGDVFRFKLFDRDGYLALVSDEAAYAAEKVSERDHSAKASGVLATGVANVSLNDGTGKKNRPPLYVEAYVPIVDQAGKVRGVVEVYIDETRTAALFKTTFAALAIGLAIFVALIFGLPTIAFLMRSRQASEAQQRVEYLARYDAMTGLFNRASFTERLQKALEERRGEPLAVVFFDVDEFKAINDTSGHEAGDEFLKHVARCAASICGDRDIVARAGGDEFTLALRGRGETQVIELIEELMRAVGRPIDIRGRSISGRLSLGVYMVKETDSDLTEAMYKADIALYDAKKDGNTWRLFCEDMETAMRSRRALEQLIRDTVEAEGFQLHYQPLLKADTGRCAGFEALLRLPDGKGGYIAPTIFIPILEAMGLIGVVGKWVIEEAARTAATWPPHLFVSVNLSVRQFQDEQLVGQVKHALATSGLRPEQLELEVTESMLMENTDSIGRQLEELRALGVSIAMDDFGTGYSSLGYLWQFGFDKLKIDRSFVAALEDNDAQAREILDTIIMLGHKLDMSVTAEGIETDRQAEVLSALACDHFQGYLYGRPAPASEVAGFLMNDLRAAVAPQDPARAKRARVAVAAG